MINTLTLTIKEAADHLRKGDFSSVELGQSCISIINEKNPEINAVLEVFADWKEQAEEADKKIADGNKDPLCGIPIIIKDNILFQGHHASASSKILEPYTAVYSATVIKKLREVGAVILGRANMDEFAMGSSTENSAFGPTRNPHDMTRVPGGSSGGVAAAVASGMCLGALGTDTAGSIRQPAGFCGIVGFKSSYGLTSRSGVIAMGNSLDQIGPMTKTAEDAMLIQQVIGGYDELEATSVKKEEINAKTEIKTIGVPWAYVNAPGIDPEVLARFKEGIEKFREAGYEIKEVKPDKIKYSLAAYYIIMPAEVSTNLSRFDGIRYGLRAPADKLYDVYAKSRAQGFGPETRRRIMLGAYVLSHGYYDAYYRKANLVREAIKKEFIEIFKEVDVYVTPTSPTAAFKIGEKTHDPLSMYMADIFTVPANIAGLPAISVPNGTTKNGLPLDIEFNGSYGSDDAIFELAKKFETIRDSK